uniref:Retrotransposon Copia-like N-terminal domain-containing protein n=1 Tax=Cajanus cajan TaxID=3821 RepID=A0A151TV57_CAJCA|nr:hypothetical protein KK1_010201 [Cajanus cajan]
MASATSTIFVPQTFSSTISCKLRNDNYLTWMHHAKATIKGFQLKKHILGISMIPREYLSKEDQAKGIVNPEYENFEQQDNLLKSWLLESMEAKFKVYAVGCEWRYQIWDILKTYFTSHTRARIKHPTLRDSKIGFNQ